MQVISINCPSCGAAYHGNFASRYITCDYCGTRFMLSPEEAEQMGFGSSTGEPFAEEEDSFVDDGSDASMPAFAREEVEKFLRRGDVDEDDFKETQKIVRGLNISNDDIYLIHDDTLFKSGKNGFAITNEGLYCREMMESTVHFVSWSDFAQGEYPEIDDSYIRVAGTPICYFSGNDDLIEGPLFDMYQRLYNHAVKVC